MSAPGVAHDDLDELAFLAQTAGADISDRIVQRRLTPSPATYVGKGKLDELRDSVRTHDAELVVFDDDLSPAQNRTVEKHVGVRVIDRSTLILDIFAAHARTHESKLQVELAQLEYLLPRLTRMWTHLDRAGGGIGTRGPGETQLEVDRRRIRTRVAQLRRKIEDVESERLTQRRGRRNLFKVALAGYTNAGKSTLFNALTRADVRVENKLFATLDTTTRKVHLGDRATGLISDTVGFIKKLPHHLVASFHATLREVAEADLVLHVVDASSPRLEDQIETVGTVLDELVERTTRHRLVLNKIDCLDDDAYAAARARHPEAWLVSAITPGSVKELRGRLAEARAEWSVDRGISTIS